MKKNTLLYIIITILLIIIAVGVTYIILNNKNEEEVIEPNDKEEDNNKEEENYEQVILNDEELEKYLSYVPNELYKKQIANINTIDKNILRNTALIIASECLYEEKTNCPFDTSKEIPIKIDLFPYYENNIATSYIPLTYLNEVLHEMYNYELNVVENAKSIDDVFSAGGMAYIYQDGYFLLLGGGQTTGVHINLIESYKVNDENLIIYEYVAYYDSFENTLNDYYTNKETDLNGWCGNTSGEEKKELLDNYLNDHKDEFTLYKHTFKKNNTGYYWYSTEVEGDNN